MTTVSINAVKFTLFSAIRSTRNNYDGSQCVKITIVLDWISAVFPSWSVHRVGVNQECQEGCIRDLVRRLGAATERAQHLEVGAVMILVIGSFDRLLLYGWLR